MVNISFNPSSSKNILPSSDFVSAAEKTIHSVVHVKNTSVSRGNSSLWDYFNDQGDKTRVGMGSGVIISEDGYIITNNHVIANAEDILVRVGDKEYKAKLIGADPYMDVAVLKMETKDKFKPVKFGDSDLARVGDWAVAIGNPFGLGGTVTAGIISARNRDINLTRYDDFIQTDAAINRGNSGGPLFNMNGEVIGVNTAIISPNGGSIGLGFSMSSRVVGRVVNQLKEFGETRRGWLGVQIQDIDSDMAEALGLNKASGALVSGVPDGPGADAGILSGDVILSFDGVEVKDTRGLVSAVGNADVGKVVRVIIFRDGKTRTIKVTLGRRESAEKVEIVPTAKVPEKIKETEELGMKLMSITSETREQLNLPDDATGVAVLDVNETSDAFEKGIRAGDIIVEAGRAKVTTVNDISRIFEKAINSGRKSILMLVVRGDNSRFVGLSLSQK